MPQRSFFWTTHILGVVIYGLIFIYAHNFWQMNNAPVRGQPELLLFMLPGVCMALLQAKSPLKSTVLIACWGTLLAAMLLNSTLLLSGQWLYLSAWILSAIFWAGCGALLVRLLRIVWVMRN
ncbi:inner membrane protein YbjM [Pantoea sp. LMR881]|uniref:inner membrane protein YbjM n=1 Tax=Pantoea sp. LMR881 TaxID=3014336 RepID=UPI0022AFE861|nr:inner membrane protein YbjM [Pantoea sp. LMR881]MCZ4058853.1 inner membrane protein YbjM [Pantoea sp. LMR881]